MIPIWSLFERATARTHVGGRLPNQPFFGALIALTCWIISAGAAHAEATRWQLVPGASTIGFSGDHSGNKFKGTFTSFEATIAFDPADLAGSKATVTVALASAKTGDATYDKTLPTADWFDIAHGPTGVFATTAFRATGDAFEADGTLTIRGFAVPLTLAFTFKPTGDTALLTGATSVKRLDFGIGRGSDGDGSWVSLEIPIVINVTLARKP